MKGTAECPQRIDGSLLRHINGILHISVMPGGQIYHMDQIKPMVRVAMGDKNGFELGRIVVRIDQHIHNRRAGVYQVCPVFCIDENGLAMSARCGCTVAGAQKMNVHNNLRESVLYILAHKAGRVNKKAFRLGILDNPGRCGKIISEWVLKGRKIYGKKRHFPNRQEF